MNGSGSSTDARPAVIFLAVGRTVPVSKAGALLPEGTPKLWVEDVASLAETLSHDFPATVVIDVDHLPKDSKNLLKALDKRTAPLRVVAIYTPAKRAKNRAFFTKLKVTELVPKPLDVDALAHAIRNSVELVGTSLRLADMDNRLTKAADQIDKLYRIGTALSTEHNLQRLLDMILFECRRATSADAGSLYLIEEGDPEENQKNPAWPYRREKEFPKQLRFTCSQNDSISVPFVSFAMPVSTASISGYVAAKGEVLNLRDVYELPEGTPFSFNSGFDKKSGYRSVSMLVVPMRNHKGDITGVIQLINKKKNFSTILDKPENTPRHVTAFDDGDAQLLLSLASQAAVSIEKVRLIDDVEKLFEALAQSFAATLEYRDTATGGHSYRLAQYAQTVARIINEQTTGPFAGVKFSEDELRELKYASYLHDVGKIAVREAVLTKAHKLAPEQMEAVRRRFEMLRFKRLTQAVADGELKPGEAPSGKVKDELDRLDKEVLTLMDVNKRGFVSDEEIALVQSLAKQTFQDTDGSVKPLLTEFEVDNLTIRRGNLTGKEREIIESHIAYTWEILRKIPWPKMLKNVPHIAGSHHEKMDGTGYPHGLKSEQMLIQAKILGLLDIFEALTARDRPYKPPMPIPKALEIIKAEVDANHLDKDLFDLFVNNRVYEQFKGMKPVKQIDWQGNN